MTQLARWVRMQEDNTKRVIQLAVDKKVEREMRGIMGEPPRPEAFGGGCSVIIA